MSDLFTLKDAKLILHELELALECSPDALEGDVLYQEAVLEGLRNLPFTEGKSCTCECKSCQLGDH